jgi:predicted RNA polymerase sigma factor
VWDRTRIREGTALIDAAITKGAIGEYQLQAAIAALHSRAVRVEETDWLQIVALYGLLERMTGNPIVTLNRAIAVAMVDGPAAGLAAPGHAR